MRSGWDLLPSGALWSLGASGVNGIAMAGYSPRSLVQKLGIMEGDKILMVLAPADVKVCSVDETWSGLKFMIRLRDRQ